MTHQYTFNYRLYIWMTIAVLFVSSITMLFFHFFYGALSLQAAPHVTPQYESGGIFYDIALGSGVVTTSIWLDADPERAVLVRVHESSVGIDIGDPTVGSDAIDLYFDSTNWAVPQEVSITIDHNAPEMNTKLYIDVYQGKKVDSLNQTIIVYDSSNVNTIVTTTEIGVANPLFFTGGYQGLDTNIQGVTTCVSFYNLDTATEPVSISALSLVPGVSISSSSIQDSCYTFELEIDYGQLPLNEFGMTGYIDNAIVFVSESDDTAFDGFTFSMPLGISYLIPNCYYYNKQNPFSVVGATTTVQYTCEFVTLVDNFDSFELDIIPSIDGIQIHTTSPTITAQPGVYAYEFEIEVSIDRSEYEEISENGLLRLFTASVPDGMFVGGGSTYGVLQSLNGGFYMSITPDRFPLDGEDVIVQVYPFFLPSVGDTYTFTASIFATSSHITGSSIDPTSFDVTSDLFAPPIELTFRYDVSEHNNEWEQIYAGISLEATNGMYSQLNANGYIYGIVPSEFGIQNGIFLFSELDIAAEISSEETTVQITVQLVEEPTNPVILQLFESNQSTSFVGGTGNTYTVLLFDEANWSTPQEVTIAIAPNTVPGDYHIQGTYITGNPRTQHPLTEPVVISIPQTAQDTNEWYQQLNPAVGTWFSYTSNSQICFTVPMGMNTPSNENPLTIQYVSSIPGIAFTEGTQLTFTSSFVMFPSNCLSYTINREALQRNAFGPNNVLSDAMIFAVYDSVDEFTPYFIRGSVFDESVLVSNMSTVNSYTDMVVSSTATFSSSYLDKITGVNYQVHDTDSLSFIETGVLSGVYTFVRELLSINLFPNSNTTFISAQIASDNPNWDGTEQFIQVRVPKFDVLSSTELDANGSTSTLIIQPLFSPIQAASLYPSITSFPGVSQFNPSIPMEGIDIDTGILWKNTPLEIPFQYNFIGSGSNSLSISNINSFPITYSFIGGPPTVDVYHSGEVVFTGVDSFSTSAELFVNGDPIEPIEIQISNTLNVDRDTIITYPFVVFDESDTFGEVSTYVATVDSSNYQSAIILPLFFDGVSNIDIDDDRIFFDMSICTVSTGICGDATTFVLYVNLLDIVGQTPTVTFAGFDVLEFLPSQHIWYYALVDKPLYDSSSYEETFAQLQITTESEYLEVNYNGIFNGSFEAMNGVTSTQITSLSNRFYIDDEVLFPQGDAAHGNRFMRLQFDEEINTKQYPTAAEFFMYTPMGANDGSVPLDISFMYRTNASEEPPAISFMIPEVCEVESEGPVDPFAQYRFVFNVQTNNWDCLDVSFIVFSGNLSALENSSYVQHLDPNMTWTEYTRTITTDIFDNMTDEYAVRGNAVGIDILFIQFSTEPSQVFDVDMLRIVDPAVWSSTLDMVIFGDTNETVYHDILFRRTSLELPNTVLGYVRGMVSSTDSRLQNPDTTPFTLLGSQTPTNPPQKTGRSSGGVLLPITIPITEVDNALRINNGAESTNSLRALVSFSGVNIAELFGVAISFSPDFYQTSYQPFMPVMQIMLAPVRGLQTVYAKLRTLDGRTQVVSDSIFVEYDEHVVMPPVNSSCPVRPDTALKTALSNTIFYITPQCTKLRVPTPNLYFTYFTSWSTVQTVPQSTIDAVPAEPTGFFPYGPLYTPQYGALVKTPFDPKVYLILNDTKYWITDETVFNTLGYEWNWIEGVDPRFLDKYPTGSEITDITKHPDYTIVKYSTSERVYRLEPGPNNTTVKRWIPDEPTFTRLNFRWDRILTIPDTFVYADGEDLTN